ncbi:hypothetical protein [Phyllobacterium sp. SB3]|uniref:hypothetical protein n=1 Tax=Phyllobacterium sp. SB3 TaxID=3156073 RepID=UPI0032AF35C8
MTVPSMAQWKGRGRARLPKMFSKEVDEVLRLRRKKLALGQHEHGRRLAVPVREHPPKAPVSNFLANQLLRYQHDADIERREPLRHARAVEADSLGLLTGMANRAGTAL